MVSFKVYAHKHRYDNDTLKGFHIALKKDTWDAVLPFLWEEMRRRKRGEKLIPDFYYEKELEKYLMDYGVPLELP